MTRSVVIAVLISLLVVAFAVAPAHAQGGTYIVKPGDTLLKIARVYNMDVSRLAAANGLRWNAWVYSGQQLVIPGSSSSSSSSASTPASTGSGDTYVVQRGDTLSSIARRHGVSVSALRAANNLGATSLIVSGQRLSIPDGSGSAGDSTAASSQVPAPPAGHGANGEKWIDVNLSTQTLVAYEGQTPVLRTIVSTGTSRYPTVVGTYHIYVKYRSARMRGGYGADYYDLPNVPHVMYFYGGYGLHGTYWHNNFGTPMSHGCVNLTQSDASWVYNWAPVGTKVVTHY